MCLRLRQLVASFLLAAVVVIQVASAFALPKPNVYGRSVLSSRNSASVPNSPFQRKLPSLNNRQEESATDGGIAPISTTKVALAAFSAVALAAKTGLLPGMDGDVYSDAMILRDLGSAVLSAVLATLFVESITFASKEGYLEPRDSRKIIHTLSAPLFILVWPAFSASPNARYFAAVVSIVKAFRLYSAGKGSEKSLANAVNRSGNAEEALGGPLIYVIILSATILAFWRSSPVGIVALTTLAVGDGLADLVGRRLGKNNKWPGLDKSIAGSLAFVIGSTLASVGLLEWMSYWGCLTLPYELSELFVRIAGITFCSAILELVPIADDNYTVPLSAALLAILVL